MGWIILATAGQFLNAIVAILDKYIVSDERLLPKPFVFAFYSCLITGFWVLIFLIGLLPGLTGLGAPSLANIQSPTIQVIGMALLSAYAFFIALVSMYDALQRSDAATVIPVIGSVVALASFVLSYLLLGDALPTNFIYGIALLAVGSALVAQTFPKRTIVVQVIHSGIFFALHYITMKGLFDETNFDDGFFWSRVGLVIFALSLLLVPMYWQKITENSQKVTARGGLLVLGSKMLAGVASFLLLKATDWGEVAVVQSLEALKFVFIVVITTMLAHWLPPTATERELRPQEVWRRVLYIAVIAMGFFILFT